jgi:hypothetical protein
VKTGMNPAVKKSSVGGRKSGCCSARAFLLDSRMGAPGTIRTCDTRFRKPMLYPLSYGGTLPILPHDARSIVTTSGRADFA